VKFSALPSRSAKSLVKKLVKKFDMEKNLAIQIVDIAPTTTDELASFLARSPRTYTPDEAGDILELLESSMKKGAAKKKK
jgi:DNA-directed RNA polymerase subunit F